MMHLKCVLPRSSRFHPPLPLLIVGTLLIEVSAINACGAFARRVAPATQAGEGDLVEVLEPIRAEHELPALAGLVLQGGRVVGVGAVGARRVDSPVPVTTGDRWHLGSCTKSMTATVIAILIERGELDWSTSPAEVFPELAAHSDWRGVTLAGLLQHVSGLADPGDQALWQELLAHEGSPLEQRLTLVASMLSRPLDHEPGAFVYSNAGFAIAGAMAERVSGESFETLLATELFEPLGMSTAGFGAPGSGGAVNEPFGHFGHRSRRVRELGPGDDNPAAIAPAGAAHASLDDWARYAEMHLAGARGEDGLVSAETFEILHTPATGAYAMGWGASQSDALGHRLLVHDGSNQMWFAQIVLMPELDAAILVATNGGGDDAHRAVYEARAALYEQLVGEGVDDPHQTATASVEHALVAQL